MFCTPQDGGHEGARHKCRRQHRLVGDTVVTRQGGEDDGGFPASEIARHPGGGAGYSDEGRAGDSTRAGGGSNEGDGNSM